MDIESFREIQVKNKSIPILGVILLSFGNTVNFLFKPILLNPTSLLKNGEE